MGKTKKSETGNASKCTKARSKKVYIRKRKHYGNQYSIKKAPEDCKTTTTSPTTIEDAVKTKRKSIVTEEDMMKTASFKKIKEVAVAKSNTLDGFRIIDVSILLEFIGLFSCPECQEKKSLHIDEDMLKRKGLSSFLVVKCSTCFFSYSIYTSNGAKNNKKSHGS